MQSIGFLVAAFFVLHVDSVHNHVWKSILSILALMNEPSSVLHEEDHAECFCEELVCLFHYHK